MRIEWNTPISELYHSDNVDYIDLGPDEIMHWRYIKREKLPNGTYRYYYNQSDLDAAKRKADRADRAQSRAAGDAVNARVDFENNYSGKSDKERFTNYAKARLNLGFKSAAAKKAVKRYEKMKVDTFVERTISKGVVAVANFFSGISGLFGKKKQKQKRQKALKGLKNIGGRVKLIRSVRKMFGG